MTLLDGIQKSVDERNVRMVGKIVDTLRFKHGFNYQDTFELFHKHSGISQPDFEALMYEVDSSESYG